MSLQKKLFAFSLVLCSVFAACTTMAPKKGYYQYDFVRTFKGIEDEWNFAQEYGMKMVQELTLAQTGAVAYFENGILYDPALQINLSIDRDGIIASVDNVSVHGEIQRNGKFYWNGLIEQHGRLNSVFVSGTLLPLPRNVRAGSEYNGIYHLTDSGTGKAQLARISDGFYTWSFADGSDPGWKPWPTLVSPNGAIAFSMNMTTVMQMGEQKTSFSTEFAVQGTVNAGKSIMLKEYSHTAGTLIPNSVRSDPLIYSGNMIREGDYPADALPADMQNMIAVRKDSGAQNIKNEPLKTGALKKNQTIKYPLWYIQPPRNGDAVYAVGEKTFENRETALALAEAAAAASIAEYIRVHVSSTSTTVQTDASRSFENRINTQSAERVQYTVIKSEYDEGSSTAFVLVAYNIKKD
jgi:hypothetical protein